MVALNWLRGLLTHRPTRILATAIGVAVAVALIASIGAFLSATNAKMTQRAIARVAVDWQVQVQPGSDATGVLSQVRSYPEVKQALTAQFTQSPGLTATTHGTTQTTGAAQLLGLAPGYAAAFPGELRLLSGTLDGVLIAQQTASNLHVAPGDTVTVARPGVKPAQVTVSGVVDLPYADSLFQKVGALPGAQATAPPDNVLILPQAEFARVERPVIAARPELIHTQIHATLSHALPSSPSAAFDQITARAHNLESRLTGAGIVATTSARRSTPPARTPSTRRSCSCSSASRERSSPGS